MFVVNSRLGLSSAATKSSESKSLHFRWPSFSLSYGCILQSSLTGVSPRTLEFSSCPPVSVSVRALRSSLGAFLGSAAQLASLSPKGQLPIASRPYVWGICLPYSLPASTRSSNRAPSLPSASPHGSNGTTWHWTFRQFSVRLSTSLRLRSRLTQRRRSLLWKPRAFGEADSRRLFRYSCRHSHFHTLRRTFQFCFTAHGTLPYPSYK